MSSMLLPALARETAEFNRRLARSVDSAAPNRRTIHLTRKTSRSAGGGFAMHTSGAVHSGTGRGGTQPLARDVSAVWKTVSKATKQRIRSGSC